MRSAFLTARRASDPPTAVLPEERSNNHCGSSATYSISGTVSLHRISLSPVRTIKERERERARAYANTCHTISPFPLSFLRVHMHAYSSRSVTEQRGARRDLPVSGGGSGAGRREAVGGGLGSVVSVITSATSNWVSRRTAPLSVRSHRLHVLQRAPSSPSPHPLYLAVRGPLACSLARARFSLPPSLPPLIAPRCYSLAMSERAILEARPRGRGQTLDSKSTPRKISAREAKRPYPEKGRSSAF